MKKNILLGIMILLVVFGTFTFAGEVNNKSIERSFSYKQSIVDASILYLPMNEGNVEVKYIDGNDIMIDLLLYSDNDSSYSKSLIDSFDLKFIKEMSYMNSKTRIKLMPYLGERRVFDQDNDENFWYCMEDGFKWNTYGYDKDKTNIRMDYVISLPKRITSVRLRNCEGEVKLPNDKFESADISLFNSTLFCQELNSNDLTLTFYDDSKGAISGKLNVGDNCSIGLYSSSCELNTEINSDLMNISLYDNSNLKIGGPVNVKTNSNINVYSSQLAMDDRADITTNNFILQCFSDSSVSLNGNIEAYNLKLENYDSMVTLDGENIDANTIKLEGGNGTDTRCSSNIAGESIKITGYGADFTFEGNEIASNSMILEMFSNSKISMKSDFTSVENGKIEAYSGSNLNIKTNGSLKNRVKKEIYSGAKLVIDGVRQ